MSLLADLKKKRELRTTCEKTEDLLALKTADLERSISLCDKVPTTSQKVEIAYHATEVSRVIDENKWALKQTTSGRATLRKYQQEIVKANTYLQDASVPLVDSGSPVSSPVTNGSSAPAPPHASSQTVRVGDSPVAGEPNSPEPAPGDGETFARPGTVPELEPDMARPAGHTGAAPIAVKRAQMTRRDTDLVHAVHVHQQHDSPSNVPMQFVRHSDLKARVASEVKVGANVTQSPQHASRIATPVADTSGQHASASAYLNSLAKTTEEISLATDAATDTREVSEPRVPIEPVVDAVADVSVVPEGTVPVLPTVEDKGTVAGTIPVALDQHPAGEMNDNGTRPKMYNVALTAEEVHLIVHLRTGGTLDGNRVPVDAATQTPASVTLDQFSGSLLQESSAQRAAERLVQSNRPMSMAEVKKWATPPERDHRHTARRTVSHDADIANSVDSSDSLVSHRGQRSGGDGSTDSHDLRKTSSQSEYWIPVSHLVDSRRSMKNSGAKMSRARFDNTVKSSFHQSQIKGPSAMWEYSLRTSPERYYQNIINAHDHSKGEQGEVVVQEKPRWR